MRRLPIYVLLDCSESMIGTGIQAMQNGIGTMVASLQSNPHALDTAWLSFITFDSRADLRNPLQPIHEVQVPRLRVRPGTAFGSALLLLADRIMHEVRKNQPGQKGDFRPIVILITDGQPTDAWQTPLRELHRSTSIANFYAIGTGDDIDFASLREVTDIVLNLNQTDEHSWARLFVWISDTLSTASMRVAEGDERDPMLARLPEGLREVPGGEVPGAEWTKRPDQGALARQLFLHVLCGNDKSPYLIRYRFNAEHQVYDPIATHTLDPETCDFNRPDGSNGLPPVDSSRVNGVAPCPHCGNGSAGACGNCGTLFCGSAVQADGNSVCPGCSNQLSSSSGSSGFKIRIRQG